MVNVPPKGGRKHPDQDYIHVDTKNILFICGGAFDGLEQIIEQRRGNQTIGFGGDIKTKSERVARGVFKDVTSHDIVKYGLIPELVGRLPMIVSLDNLDEEALVRIIKEPKNALCKQYEKLMEMDGIRLVFEDDALRAIAHMAKEKESGARGLRSILENIMTDAMFDLPSRTDVDTVTVTRAYVEGKAPLCMSLKSGSASLPSGN